MASGGPDLLELLAEAVAERVAAKVKRLPSAEPPPYLDTGGVAKLLGVSREVVSRVLVRREGLPHFRVGRLLRFDEACIREWAREREARGGT